MELLVRVHRSGAVLREEKVAGAHTRVPNAEGEELRFEQAARVGTEVTEFVHLDAGFETEDAFDVGDGRGFALEDPEAEKFVVETGEACASMGFSCQTVDRRLTQ
jgi:hypothetical protein